MRVNTLEIRNRVVIVALRLGIKISHKDEVKSYGKIGEEEESCGMDVAQEDLMAERSMDKDEISISAIGMVLDQMVQKMHGEGIFNQMIMKLLNEMKMVNENGENIWKENDEM
jgi:hypothetical protein